VGVPESFANLKLGDQVEVLRRRTKAYRDAEEAQREDGGTVVQITDKFVAVKHWLGYIFCVSRADVLTGIKTLRKKGDGEMETPEVYAAEREAAVREAPPACCEVESGGETSEAVAEVVAEQKLEFSRETVERLLAEGVSKYQLKRMFNLSNGKLYQTLAKWGLHKPQRGVGRGTLQKAKARRVQGPAPSSGGQVGKEITLAEALRMRDDAQAKFKAVTWLIELCGNAGGVRGELADHPYAKDALPLLEGLRSECEAELKRIEAVLEKVKVVI
jgi:hypothetical protein